MSSKKGSGQDEEKEVTGEQPKVLETAIEFVSMGERPPKGRARYRDPANPFNTWGGRGKRPDWLRKYLDNGRALTEFEISED
ncbi:MULTISPECIES: H-NS histone family protein [Pseudomonas]